MIANTTPTTTRNGFIFPTRGYANMAANIHTRNTNHRTMDEMLGDRPSVGQYRGQGAHSFSTAVHVGHGAHVFWPAKVGHVGHAGYTPPIVVVVPVEVLPDVQDMFRPTHLHVWVSPTLA